MNVIINSCFILISNKCQLIKIIIIHEILQQCVKFMLWKENSFPLRTVTGKEMSKALEKFLQKRTRPRSLAYELRF